MPDQYATISDFSARYDVRLLGDLVNDDNTRSGSLSGNAILTTLLTEATARVKAAAQSRGAYTESQLDALYVALDPFLIGLVCDVAMGLLYRRRGKGMPDGHQEVFDAAMDQLKDLRDGRLVFGDTAAIAAQVPAPYRMNQATANTAFPVTTSPLYPASNRPPDLS